MNEPAALLSFLPFDNDTSSQLARLIQAGRCALVLGPHCTSTEINGRRVPLRAALAHELAEYLSKTPGMALPDPYDLPAVSSAFMARPGASRIDLEMKVEDFYARHKDPGETLMKVAKLPFRLVMTVAPDGLLQTALKRNSRRYLDSYYRMGETQTDNYTPDADRMFVYQLFGKVDPEKGNNDGLILTHEDQMRYIDSVQGVGKETRLPPALRNALQQCKTFLFIGFDFEQWYLRVLLHILQFGQHADKVFGLHDAGLLDDGTHLFFKQQYKFSFLDAGPEVMLDNLLERLKPAGTSTYRPQQGRKPVLRLLYLHAPGDKALCETLDRHLRPLCERYGFETMSIQELKGGDTIVVEKQKMLEEANLIVPIITAHFVADEQLAGEFTAQALARHGAERVRVAAVYASEVHGGPDLFAHKAPVFPARDMAVSEFGNPDKAYQKIATELEKIIEGMISS